MLGVVGDSGAGKTTLVRGVVQVLGRYGVTPICLDDYHRHDRAQRQRLGISDSDPAANNLPLMAEHLRALRSGTSISKPVYDHRTGTLRDSELVAPTGLVIAYGMLTLTPPSLADLFDLTIYLDPDDSLRRRWRLERDVRLRGYTPDQVATFQEQRERDARRFVHVQRPHADLLVRFTPAADGGAGLDLHLVQRRRRLAPLDLAAIGGDSLSPHMIWREVAAEDGLPAHVVDLASAAPPEALRQICRTIWRMLPAAYTGGEPGPPDTVNIGNTLGLAQLVTIYHLQRAYAGRGAGGRLDHEKHEL